MSGGAGDPLPGDLAAQIGERWYRYIALGINDNATLAAWHAESRRRYAVPIQAGFRIFTGYRGTYEEGAEFGEVKNYEHICCPWLSLNPFTVWEAAAALCGAAAPRLYNNPVTSLEGVLIPGLVGDVSYNDFTVGNSLLYKGMSVLEVGKDGSVYIKRLISMYQTRSDGSADDAWLDINVAEAMERIRYEQRMGAIQRFRGTVAAKTNEGFRPGLAITTEDSVKAFLLSIYQNVLMREYGWVQAYGYYKGTLVVEQDPQNPSRFNFRDDPVINSPFYILAGRSQFRKAIPNF
jgi:phage tail sheath gpL-like